MPTITAAATILLVKDVLHSVNWYREKLGFSLQSLYGGDHPYFAIISRDGQYIMFSKADAALIQPNWKIAEKTCNIYFWVDDVETLYQQFINSGATIDYTLSLRSYGVKEFGINDPDEYDIAFGQIMQSAHTK